MKSFDAWKLAALFSRIEHTRTIGIKHEMDQGNRDALVSEDFRTNWVGAILRDAREMSEKAELPATDSRVNPNGGLSLALQDGLTYQELDYQLKFLRESIQVDLSSKYVYIIESDKQKYHSTSFLLKTWGPLWLCFPSARKDARSAMAAYVYGLDTACVFHLMRIAEIGLRALARRMRIRLPKGKSLQWAQWNTIIIEMNKKADAIANRKASNAREEQLEFYRGAIGEFLGYKDAYRNFVMHMREKSNYDSDEARSLIGRVSHFMDRLSGKIDERGCALTEARRNKMLARLDAKMEAEKQKADEQTKQGIRELQQDNAATNKHPPLGDTGRTESGEDGQRKKAES